MKTENLLAYVDLPIDSPVRIEANHNYKVIEAIIEELIGSHKSQSINQHMQLFRSFLIQKTTAIVMGPAILPFIQFMYTLQDPSGLIIIPQDWYCRYQTNPIRYTGDIVTMASRAKDCYNMKMRDSRLIQRGMAWEAEFLITEIRKHPNISLIPTQTKLLNAYPKGITNTNLNYESKPPLSISGGYTIYVTEELP